MKPHTFDDYKTAAQRKYNKRKRSRPEDLDELPSPKKSRTYKVTTHENNGTVIVGDQPMYRENSVFHNCNVQIGEPSAFTRLLPGLTAKKNKSKPSKAQSNLLDLGTRLRKIITRYKGQDAFDITMFLIHKCSTYGELQPILREFRAVGKKLIDSSKQDVRRAEAAEKIQKACRASSSNLILFIQRCELVQKKIAELSHALEKAVFQSVENEANRVQEELDEHDGKEVDQVLVKHEDESRVQQDGEQSNRDDDEESSPLGSLCPRSVQELYGVGLEYCDVSPCVLKPLHEMTKLDIFLWSRLVLHKFLSPNDDPKNSLIHESIVSFLCENEKAGNDFLNLMRGKETFIGELSEEIHGKDDAWTEQLRWFCDSVYGFYGNG